MKIEAASRLMASKPYKVTKLEDGDFEYRDIEFMRVDRLKGYSDYYRTIRKVKGLALSAPSQRDLLKKINQQLDADIKEIK